MTISPVIEVACALLINEGKVLIAQRGNGKHQAGKWEFPGGKRKENESVEAALQREIKEELGIEIEIVKPLTITQYGYAEFNIKLFPFIGKIVKGVPTCTEHSDLAWVTAQNIMSYDLAPADIPVALEWTMMQQ